MMYSPQEILRTTESLLKYDQDEKLEEATPQHLHDSLGRAVMLAIGDNWANARAHRAGKRKAFYLSAEYLIGRLVFSNLFNLGVLEEMRRAFAERGVDLASLEEIEDAALGNGGLGRLAACYLDSAATCGIPLSGYGLRYRFGLFKQSFDKDGSQKEAADDWAKFGDPWSYRRDKHTVRVHFADQTVLAVPYDVPVIGYNTDNIGTLRLWQCEAEEELDFDAFNQQDYVRALMAKNQAEDITRVLYPNDSTREGKRLRIKQQYFLSSASLQDILSNFRETVGDLHRLAEFTAVQLNDTHPAMSIPELIRLLMLEGLDFDEAFSITREVFSYTNHTVMHEALECWDMELLRSVVPEICDIIIRIEEKLCEELPESGLHILTNDRVHMAELSVYMGKRVNGVAEIHTEILKNDLFADWNRVYPEKFVNVTNGVTPRRWLGLCNSELTELIRREIGEGFLRDLDRIGYLKDHVSDSLAEEFNAIKRKKKEQLAAHICKTEGVELPADFVFDVQVKRAHEYKRQLMNALGLADLYFSLKNGELTDFPPTAFIFGAKSAPGYRRAKAVIRYINRLAKLVNADPSVNDRMRIVFVQNYNCSYAERILPAADISEQISPAGTEASGTGNMKLMLNGAVTLGTMDGANVEIVRQAGEENNYIFGGTVEENNAVRDTYDPKTLYESDSRIRRALDTLVDGTVPTDSEQKELFDAILEGASWHKPDNYFVLRDFESYREARLRAIYDTRDSIAFGKKCLYNVAAAGLFSSDRAVKQYADLIWNL